jgi:hypothetical protein
MAASLADAHAVDRASHSCLTTIRLADVAGADAPCLDLEPVAVSESERGGGGGGEFKHRTRSVIVPSAIALEYDGDDPMRPTVAARFAFRRIGRDEIVRDKFVVAGNVSRAETIAVGQRSSPAEGGGGGGGGGGPLADWPPGLAELVVEYAHRVAARNLLIADRRTGVLWRLQLFECPLVAAAPLDASAKKSVSR